MEISEQEHLLIKELAGELYGLDLDKGVVITVYSYAQQH